MTEDERLATELLMAAQIPVKKIIRILRKTEDRIAVASVVLIAAGLIETGGITEEAFIDGMRMARRMGPP